MLCIDGAGKYDLGRHRRELQRWPCSRPRACSGSEKRKALAGCPPIEASKNIEKEVKEGALHS